VTVGVVHQLEEIDVDDEQRHRKAGGGRDLEGGGELLDERATKRKLRQVVDAENGEASERKGLRRPSVPNRKSGGAGDLAGAGAWT
jgi:hypothetical protein